MKTSLSGIAWIVWFILNLSHQGAAEFLEDRCWSPTPGGGRASTGSGTWMVALRNGTDYLCAGSLIHKRFVLTAAECIDGQRTITAMLGVTDKSHPKYEVSVARVLIHRSYARETGSNNIALVMLSHKVKYNETVQPICINLNAVRSDVEAFSEFDTFDWEIGTNRRGREALQWIRIERHNRSYCGNGPDQSYICGGPARPGDCGGAIGGPLSISMTINGRRETHPVQFGIVSSGQRPCEGYRSYVDVTSYTDWIEQIVRAFDTLAVDEVVPQPSQDPRPSAIRRQNQQLQRPESEEMLLYNDCGQMYLIANIFGPDFMAKGVMITHRFVLTTASGLPEDVSSLRVGVAGDGTYQEITIHLVFKHQEEDIALLKLSRELVHEDRMKPICMLRRAISAEYLSLLGVVDIDRTERTLGVKFMRSTLLEQLRCKASLGISIELSQICVQNPPGLTQFFGIRGNALAKQIVLPGKSTSMYALFGILTYSSNGIHVITKISPFTDWIVSVVSENSVGNTTSF